MKKMTFSTSPTCCRRKHMENIKPPPTKPTMLDEEMDKNRDKRCETDATMLQKVILKKDKEECHNNNISHHHHELEEQLQNQHETEVQGGESSNRRNRSRTRLMTSITAESRSRSNWDSLMRWTLVAAVLLLHTLTVVGGEDRDHNSVANSWERPGVMPKISHLEVMCGNQHMEVHLAFDKPFSGLVTSKGMYGQGDCVYVPPRTGKSEFVFNIYYDKCGTKPDNQGKFYENTIVVQYDEELIEAWDEAKRLRCEWFNDYEKTATKTSPMVISDLDIVELNFHGDNVDAWMEIQEGKGPWAAPLNGIAPLGSPLTMVIAVKDPSGEFDMRVKDCEASDGASGRSLALSDPEGCIMRPKLLGKFSKIKLDDGRATVLTYAFISAFKFPDMLNVHLRCTIEICRHGCPEHCTSSAGAGNKGSLGSYSENEPVALGSIASPSYSKAVAPPPHGSSTDSGSNSNESSGDKVNQALHQQQPQMSNNLAHHSLGPPPPPHHHQQNRFPPQQPHHHTSGEMFNANVPPQMRPPPPPLPQFGGRPQRAPRPQPQPHPHLQPPPQPHHYHSKFPPGLVRQRPEFQRFPPGPPMPRFTGAIKHTIPGPLEGGGEGPAGRSPNEETLEETRQRATLAQNMLLKPEPKVDEDGKLSERSGEPSTSKEEGNPDKAQTGGQAQKTEEKAGESKENGGEREMLMEAQPLKDESSAPQKEEKLKDNNSPLEVELPGIASTTGNFPKGPRHLRLRRSVSSSRDVIGVAGAFKVVSQADLDFALNPNSSSTASNPTIVLTGRMAGGSQGGEPIYGICLPRVGFGVVFFGLGLATLVAILIAAFLAYAHYAVLHYKPSTTQGTQGQGHQPHPLQFQQQQQPVFPMLILKKMW